jgi:hypothetical protein
MQCDVIVYLSIKGGGDDQELITRHEWAKIKYEPRSKFISLNAAPLDILSNLDTELKSEQAQFDKANTVGLYLVMHGIGGRVYCDMSLLRRMTETVLKYSKDKLKKINFSACASAWGSKKEDGTMSVVKQFQAKLTEHPPVEIPNGLMMAGYIDGIKHHISPKSDGIFKHGLNNTFMGSDGKLSPTHPRNLEAVKSEVGADVDSRVLNSTKKISAVIKVANKLKSDPQKLVLMKEISNYINAKPVYKYDKIKNTWGPGTMKEYSQSLNIQNLITYREYFNDMAKLYITI